MTLVLSLFFSKHSLNLTQLVQNSFGRWYDVIIIALLCLAWLRISSGKCLAAVVMMLHRNWAEAHPFTASQAALGEEQDDTLPSDTKGTHTHTDTHRKHTQPDTHRHTHMQCEKPIG